MKKIVVLAGSNSKNSINRKFALYAARQLENISVDSIDLSQIALPLYSVDLQAESGIPDAVKDIDARIEAADGLILSLAEHNGAYATAFKNVLDWLSRIDTNVWKDKPMLLMAASPGRGGGKQTLEHASGNFSRFGGAIKATFSLPSFNHNFVEGELIDADLKTEFDKQMDLFRGALEA